MINSIKFFTLSLSLFCCLFSSSQLLAQDNTSLDGDHFSLEGALELFKTSSSPENFESLLNASTNSVNNLDLNEDGEVDYIRVEDHQSENVHALVLQVAVNETEFQDIAVIEMEQTGKEEVVLQILGDENLYGEQVIVEPTAIESQLSPDGKGGPSVELKSTRVIFNVWLWPSVRFMYRPTYRVYVSPYRWNRYPTYYKARRPRTLTVFRANIVHRPHYKVVRTHRVVAAHKVYTPRRRTSVIVHKKTTSRLAVRSNSPVRKTTKTNTRVAVKKNNKASVVGKKKTTTVKAKNKNGKTRAGKKTTKVVRRK